MGAYIIRRLLLVIPTLFVIYTITFFVMHATPGGLRSVPHIVMAPAAALALTVLSFNFLGDGLRDALDPRMKN